MRTHQNNQDSISKISQSKSRKQVSVVSKLKEKEIGWNDRFYLNHIPEYNYQNQPHSQYLKNKFRLPKRIDQSRPKKMLDHSIEKSKVSNKPNPRKNEEKIKQAITKAFNDLKKLWYEKQLPQCHMQAMTKNFNRQYNTNKILEAIKHEYWEIQKNSSPIQKTITSIGSRQQCLQKIWEICNNIENYEVQKVKKQFEQKITHLRILTIHCIQCIFQWKQYVESLSIKGYKTHYLHNGILYSKKVKDDYENIIKSKVKDIYSFDKNKLDVFFVNYTIDGRKISNVSKNLIKRIRLCEIMINEESQLSPNPKRSSKLGGLKGLPKREETQPALEYKSQGSGLGWKKIYIEYGMINDYLIKMLNNSPFKDSFIPNIDVSKYEEITIMQSIDKEQQALLGIDKNATHRKIVILAVKSTIDNVQQMLKSLGDYLWENDYCTQVRIPLVYRKQGQKYSIDAELEKKLKGVGFRWASINNNNDIRMTFYSLRRPLNKVAHNTSKKTQTYPVIINHVVTFDLSGKNAGSKIPSKCFCSVLDLIRLTSEQKKEDYQQLKSKEEFAFHLQLIEKMQNFIIKQAEKQGRVQQLQEEDKYFSYSGMKSFMIEKEETLERIFGDLQIKKQKFQWPSMISVINSSFKFNHITIQDAKYTKFFPNNHSQILIVESKYPIYLLQADQENINFFVMEVDDGFSMKEIQNIFNGMGEQSSFLDEFWLPSFHKSEDYTDESGFPSSEIVSTNYTNSLGSLTRKSKKRTKIIKPPFVFGMINKRMFEILQIPFYCTLIRKQDLI